MTDKKSDLESHLESLFDEGKDDIAKKIVELMNENSDHLALSQTSRNVETRAKNRDDIGPDVSRPDSSASTFQKGQAVLIGGLVVLALFAMMGLVIALASVKDIFRDIRYSEHAQYAILASYSDSPAALLEWSKHFEDQGKISRAIRLAEIGLLESHARNQQPYIDAFHDRLVILNAPDVYDDVNMTLSIAPLLTEARRVEK